MIQRERAPRRVAPVTQLGRPRLTLKINYTTLDLQPAGDQAAVRNRTIGKGGNVTQPRAADDFATIRAAWRSCAGSARQGTLRKASCGLSRRVMVEPIRARRDQHGVGTGFANLNYGCSSIETELGRLAASRPRTRSARSLRRCVSEGSAVPVRPRSVPASAAAPRRAEGEVGRGRGRSSTVPIVRASHPTSFPLFRPRTRWSLQAGPSIGLFPQSVCDLAHTTTISALLDRAERWLSGSRLAVSISA